MMMTNRTAVVMLGLLLALLVPASARPVRVWSADELTRQADVIVIATVKSTRDARSMDNITVKAWYWVPVESVFDVQAVLKGRLNGRTVAVEHFRYSSKIVAIADGPEFVEFKPFIKNQYLIYLKKSGNAYEPLTGQEDPNFSFVGLQPYQINSERLVKITRKRSSENRQ